MFRRWISFLVLIYFLSSFEAYESEGLRGDLIATESFFEKLVIDYGSTLNSNDVTKEIDEKVSSFVHDLRSPVRWRNKRHLDVVGTERADNGVGVLKGFSPAMFEDPFTNALDISVFAHWDGIQLQWFAATLDYSRISLYLYNGNRFNEISLYPLTNGSGLIADCSELGCILVINKIDGGVTVLRLKPEINGYVLRPVQYLKGLGEVSLSIWHGMNEMFLGIASSSNISIYRWLGEHFDSIQVLNYGTEKMAPFKIGESLYLALTGSRSTVLKFLLQTNVFVVAQRLPIAYDVESFYMEKGHQREHYLVLSTHESTVIYKFVHDHFVPFQSISKADRITSVTTKETVVLLALTDNLLKIYQYDGWKFVELGVTMPEVDSVRPTSLGGETILIVRHTNSRWKFSRLNWMQQGTWEILRGEIKAWCLDVMEKTKRQPPVVPRINGPVRILRGHIEKLETKSINGKTTEPLINLSNRFETLALNLTENKQVFSQLMTKKNPKFTTLYASDFSGKCKSGCKINRLSTSVKNPLLERLARPNTTGQNLEFENVRAQSIRNLRCPKPAITLKNITVSGALNGIPFEALRDDLLRVTGDQEVTGNHIYLNYSASSALIPLEIATRSTQQDLHIRSLKADSLHLTQGGILLPLNGQPVVINTTKTVAKAKITGTVHLRCGINGTAIQHLAPVTWMEKPLLLWGNYSLQKVTVSDQSSASDLTLAKGTRSLKQIINEALRLDEDVPVHLKLSKAKTTWTNITADITEDWITVSTDKSIIRNVTGLKRSPNNLSITDSSYDALPLPKIQSKLCASEATITNIETLIVMIGRASAETLKVDYVFGAATLNATITDTATSTQNLTLHSKIFTGDVKVKNAMLDEIDGMNFQRLLAAMVGWRRPGLVEGLVNASNLVVKRLVVSEGFAPPAITKARNLICGGNIYFDTLNGVDISQLADIVVKLNEPISLTNVTFAGGLTVESIKAVFAPVDLSGTMNMGVKTIAGQLKSANLTLPYSFIYQPSDLPQSLIIKGSATFLREPKVGNINHRNLEELSEKIWLLNRPSVLSNRIFIAKHMVLEGPVEILGWVNSQSYGPWNETSTRLLSRTKPQEISTHVNLNRVKVRNIIGKEMMPLHISVPEVFLDGLGDRTLKKTGVQSLTTDMRFQKLILSDDLNTLGRINGRNLSTDVVRSDVSKNIITGKKTVLSLHADNINSGLNFSNWQRNVLKTWSTGKPIYVRGFKTFENLTLLKPLRVDGLVNNHRMEDYLLKSFPQVISGMKKIDGKIYAPEIITEGLVNDVNLTTLVEHQLKKNKPVQTIKTKILTMGDVAITGNIVANGLYHGVELDNLKKMDSDLESLSKRMSELKNAAKQIQTALSRRAWYWNKLELVEENSTYLTPIPGNLSSVDFEGLGSCTSKDGVLRCNDETVQGLIFTPNSSKILFNQVFELAGIPLIVLATSDPNGGVWIYTYENVEKTFHQIAGLNLPGATQASAITTSGSLWLAVQLTWDTIILRYEIWGEFEEYTLPGADLFFMEISPTGELLIYRSDGVWRLGGLSGPRQLARAQLNGEISTIVVDNDHYVQLVRNKKANLLKTRYIGN